MQETTDRDRILNVIATTLKQVDPNLGTISEDTILSGSGAVIDSVGFVNLLMSLEQALDHRVDLSALLTSHIEHGGDDNPFRSVGTLSELILQTMGSEPA